MFTNPFRTIYRGVRRLHVIDVTCMLHANATTIEAARHSLHHDPHRASRLIRASELADLRSENRINPVVGAGVGDLLADNRHAPGGKCLIGTFDGDRVVSFLWVATGYVPASENFSRSQHLGSSLQLPSHTGFVYNAWTDPDHRGQGCIAGMLWHLIGCDAFDLRLNDLFATTDWTNQASQRAFQKCGFENIGRLMRMGHRTWQISLVPDVQRRFQNATAKPPPINIAMDTPGLRWAW